VNSDHRGDRDMRNWQHSTVAKDKIITKKVKSKQ